MFKQKPFPASIVVLVILIAIHYVGSYYSLYWYYSWFDTLVHVFSGLWIALVLLWLASFFGQMNSLYDYKVKSFLIAFIGAIIIGVVWELLENFSQVTYTSANGYYLDTAGDILNDALGGILAYLYFIKSRRCAIQVSDNLHPFYNQTGIIKN